MPIQVFPPLELEPRNITLVIGAKFQVRVVGGPQPDSTLEFALANSKVAENRGVGLVEALTLGSTRLVARAVGVNKVTKKKITYSEDQVDVHVVKFGGIRIRTPISRMRVGTEMPVLAYGTDEHQVMLLVYCMLKKRVLTSWKFPLHLIARDCQCGLLPRSILKTPSWYPIHLFNWPQDLLPLHLVLLCSII